jgi:S1-C subfamily serine protease
MKKLIAPLWLICLIYYSLFHHKPHIQTPYVRPPSVAMNREAIRRTKAITVLISAEGFGELTRGTGILLDSTHVLTCAHVARHNNEYLWVTFSPGYLQAQAKTVYADSSADLAILEIDVPVNGAPRPVFEPNTWDGEPITIIGNALGSQKWFVTYGIVSGRNRRDLYTDGLVLGGDSGGPWINQKGEIVAISDWTLEEQRGTRTGISGGISARTVNKFLREWKHPATLLDLLKGL